MAVNIDSLPNLVGTWRLASYEARALSGETRYPLGHNVVGQLFYDAAGNMSAHVMRVDRPTFASNDLGSGTDAEVRAAFEGHVSYFGTYTVDPSARTVLHRVRGASYPNWRRVARVHPDLGTDLNAEIYAEVHRLVTCSGPVSQSKCRKN